MKQVKYYPIVFFILLNCVVYAPSSRRMAKALGVDCIYTFFVVEFVTHLISNYLPTWYLGVNSNFKLDGI